MSTLLARLRRRWAMRSMRAYGRYLQREFNRLEVREKLRALPVTHIAHRDEALPVHKVGAPCPMCDAPAT